MHNYLQSVAPESFISKFNPAIGLHYDHISRYNKEFLDPIFLKMCQALSIRPDELEFMPIDNIITENEFENKEIEIVKPYFYDTIFTMLFKNYNGKIRNNPKFTFTYDIDLTPFEQGGSKYGMIYLGEKPILYYCYVDFQSSIKFIKGLK